jgi:hypothetical protein
MVLATVGRMKVYIDRDNRTIEEMDEIFQWVLDTYGVKSLDRRWTYGKDHEFSSWLCNGTWDVDWYEFTDAKDATMFRLRWSK